MSKPERIQSSTVPSLERSLPMLLMRARDAAMQRFRPIFTDAGLTEQQWRVLRALSSEPNLDISSLAATCHIMKPSLSRIIKSLEERKLVERRANKDDQRSSTLRLAPAGEKLLSKVAPQLELCYQDIQNDVGRENLEVLYELLEATELNLKRD